MYIHTHTQLLIKKTCPLRVILYFGKNYESVSVSCRVLLCVESVLHRPQETIDFFLDVLKMLKLMNTSPGASTSLSFRCWFVFMRHYP